LAVVIKSLLPVPVPRRYEDRYDIDSTRRRKRSGPRDLWRDDDLPAKKFPHPHDAYWDDQQH